VTRALGCSCDTLRLQLGGGAAALGAQFPVGSAWRSAAEVVVWRFTAMARASSAVCTACRAVMVTGFDPALRARYASACFRLSAF
jgi:hypothetical protein